MIVTCTSCQTRFRLPDEKVGPQGARVRCSKCKALFVVKRADPPAEAPAAAPPPADPPRPPPMAAPRPATPAGLDLDFSPDPFVVPGAPAQALPPDDPFAPPPGITDPFALPARADPFAPAAAPPPQGSVPFGTPPAGDPFASDLLGMLPPMPPSDGGIALEETAGRQRTPMTSMAAYGDADLPADFRTPGPSGLDVDERKTEEQPLAPAEQAPAPPPPPEPGLAAPAPALRREPLPEPEAPRSGSGRQRVLAVLLNSLSLAALLVVAGALFVYWKGGGGGAVWATVTGRTEEARFVTRDLRSGLFDTASGRPVLFVRGRVAVVSATAGPIRVVVELVDGVRAVARAEGIVGAVPSPEEVFQVAGQVDTERLRAALAQRATPRLEPGEPQPFLVVFWEYPTDMRGLDLRVTAGPPPAG